MKCMRDEKGTVVSAIFPTNSWVSRGLERFRVLASGRVCGRARGKRSISKRLLTQELEYLPSHSDILNNEKQSVAGLFDLLGGWAKRPI